MKRLGARSAHVSTRSLRQAVYGQVARKSQWQVGIEITTDEFLGLLLQNPSVRLRQFLRRICRGDPAGMGGSERPPSRPNGSFRGYLAARKEVWTLRRMAWQALQGRAAGSSQGSSPPRRRSQENAPEELLDRLARLQEESCSHAQATALHRLANENNLSALESELIEGALLHELYGTPPPFSVRELAQMVAPETYPANCQEVVQAASGLAEKGLVELDQMGVVCTALSSRVSLAAPVLDGLLACLANDVIDDAEVKAVRRRLSFSATPPL